MQKTLKIISMVTLFTFQAFSMEQSGEARTAVPTLTLPQMREALQPYVNMYHHMNSAFDVMASSGFNLNEELRQLLRKQTFSAINNNAAAWDGTQTSMNQIILQITLESLFSGDTGDDEDGDVDTAYIGVGDGGKDDNADGSGGGFGAGGSGLGESY